MIARYVNFSKLRSRFFFLSNTAAFQMHVLAP